MPLQHHNPPLLSLLSPISKTLSKADNNVERGSRKQARTADASPSHTKWKKPPTSRMKEATHASKMLCRNHKFYFVPIVCSQNMQYWILKQEYLRAAGHKTLHFKITLKKKKTTVNINAVFKKQYWRILAASWFCENVLDGRWCSLMEEIKICLLSGADIFSMVIQIQYRSTAELTVLHQPCTVN